MIFTSEEIARIVHGSLLPATSDAAVSGISTDSRTLRPGDLFVPLHGPHYDGHDYLRQAVEHGAAACLSEEVVGGLSVPVIQVVDALQSLGEIAAHIRTNFAGPVFAITGTTGKTSTKEMLASILAEDKAGLKTEGNFNNLIGLPLTLSRLDSNHHWMVLELGMSHPGEIARLAQIAQPQVAVITNVGAGHLSGVGNISGVSHAKGELFDSLKSGTTAIVNNDDPWVAALPLPMGAERITFGIEHDADVSAMDISSGRHTSFTLLIAGGRYAVELPLPGRHQIYNALAAAAATYSIGVDIEHIVAGLSQVKMAAARLEVRELASGVTILDDSYNANPQSMQAALTALGDWPCQGRRIAVLADMLELGEAAEVCHREIGEIAAQKVDRLIAMGEWADVMIQGVAGISAEAVACAGEVSTSCRSHAEIGRWLRDNLQRDDCVLIKGSRGMHMEKVIQQFL
ncbi:MAG: UDP-N-acetylmuramoyl-tripeptide--D-alanyl-D-alanine ligase [Thermodesulfobacteriota bacterium]|nr:UDP-N-acetylmuramoyl-tripeptide--D-alanyl-D-alanine ligase [Thermodesulfobacteriota bacterium]